MAESPADTPATAGVEVLEDTTVCTVDELNDDIAAVVESADELYFDYVVGEVSDSRDVNGHVHFDLGHEDASVHCVIFAHRRQGTHDDLADGTQVAVAGDLSYYQQRGSCSVLVTDVVELGDGAYRREYEQNRRELAKDGLLDYRHKQELPAYPRTVGLVTSLDSDAREDAVTSIHDRHPDVDVVVHHATVQGDQALPSLLEAISALDRDPAVDVVVVTRGGGSDRILRVFNEPALCRVIFEADTPVVVGVGHERDRTLAEEVADQRVMTPTDVGTVVPEKAALREEHAAADGALEEAFRRTVARKLEAADGALDTAFRRTAGRQLEDARGAVEGGYRRTATRRLEEADSRVEGGYRRTVTRTLENAAAAVEAGYRHTATRKLENAAAAVEAGYRHTATRRLEAADAALADAYAAHATGVLAEAAGGLDHAIETLARERLTALGGRLDHAVAAVEQRAAHEREKEAVTREIETTYARRQRVQRAAIAVLLLVVVVLAGVLLAT